MPYMHSVSITCIWVSIWITGKWALRENVRDTCFINIKTKADSFTQAFCTLPSFAHIKRPRWRPVGLNRDDHNILFRNRCYFGLSREVMNATFCHSSCQLVNALLCSDELYCPLHQSGVAVAGATNAMNTRQSEVVTVSLFFPPPHPKLLTPSPLPTGIL